MRCYSACQASRDRETAGFVLTFDKLFDYLNLSSLNEAKKKLLTFKAPYNSAKDFRIKVPTVL